MLGRLGKGTLASFVVLAALARCSPFDDDGSSPDAADGSAPLDGSVTPPEDSAAKVDAGDGAALECLNDDLHLCDTFDDRANAFEAPRWSSVNGSGTGVLKGPAFSAPNALSVELGDASLGHYLLQRNFGAVRSVSCDIRLFLSSAETSDFGIPILISLGSEYQVRVLLRPSQDLRAALLEESASATQNRTLDLAPIGLNKWVRLEITVPEMKLRVNGVAVPGELADGGVPAAFTNAMVSVGLQTNAGSIGWGASIDDVRCTATPP